MKRTSLYLEGFMTKISPSMSGLNNGDVEEVNDALVDLAEKRGLVFAGVVKAMSDEEIEKEFCPVEEKK